MGDARRLERTRWPGIFRRHGAACARDGRCSCPFVVRWKTSGGGGRKQLFRTLAEAREFKARIDSGGRPRRKQTAATVAAYYETWLPAYRGRTRRGLEPSTRKEIETSFRLHVLPALGSVRLRDLDAPTVRDWMVGLEADGRSANTVRKARSALGAMLATAVENGDVAANATLGVRHVPARREQRPARRALTAADVRAILDALPDDSSRLLFVVLASTGLRVSEALGLTWGRVHLGDDPHVMVVEQLYKGARKRLKTASSVARVPLSAGVASWLGAVRPPDAEPTAPVFADAQGRPLTYDHLYRQVLRPALRRAGIATPQPDGRWDYHGVGFHAFRKACGSLLLAHGRTVKQVQGWLRHAQLSTTLNAYITEVDAGLGGADVWDELLGETGRRGPRGATGLAATRGNKPGHQNPEKRV